MRETWWNPVGKVRRPIISLGNFHSTRICLSCEFTSVYPVRTYKETVRDFADFSSSGSYEEEWERLSKYLRNMEWRRALKNY